LFGLPFSMIQVYQVPRPCQWKINSTVHFTSDACAFAGRPSFHPPAARDAAPRKRIRSARHFAWGFSYRISLNQQTIPEYRSLNSISNRTPRFAIRTISSNRARGDPATESGSPAARPPTGSPTIAVAPQLSSAQTLSGPPPVVHDSDKTRTSLCLPINSAVPPRLHPHGQPDGSAQPFVARRSSSQASS
jgi:hypothetical protein